MNEYDFTERLSFSKGVRGNSDMETIANLIPGCVNVSMANPDMDRLGVDYVATLRRGAEVYIDAKAREEGCSRYWAKDSTGYAIPELALEVYSVVPTATRQGKAGWTLDEAKVTDYTLHTFHPADTNEVFLLPFQLLRKAFITNHAAWTSAFRVADQSSGQWTSRCVFVPAWCVIEAIKAEMQATASILAEDAA